MENPQSSRSYLQQQRLNVSACRQIRNLRVKSRGVERLKLLIVALEFSLGTYGSRTRPINEFLIYIMKNYSEFRNRVESDPGVSTIVLLFVFTFNVLEAFLVSILLR
jgi:hypothetical protein